MERIDSYSESFANIDDGEYLKKAHVIKRDDSTEWTNQSSESGQFSRNSDVIVSFNVGALTATNEEEMFYGSINDVDEEPEGGDKNIGIKVNESKKVNKAVHNVPNMHNLLGEKGNDKFKDLRLKKPLFDENEEPHLSPTIEKVTGLQRYDSWDSIDIQKQDSSEYKRRQNSERNSHSHNEKSPDKIKVRSICL